MAIPSNADVAPEVLLKTPCDLNHACLSGQGTCQVELFVDRDLELLRCKDERTCAFKRNYNGQFICTCPVNRAAFGLN